MRALNVRKRTDTRKTSDYHRSFESTLAHRPSSIIWQWQVANEPPETFGSLGVFLSLDDRLPGCAAWARTCYIKPAANHDGEDLLVPQTRTQDQLQQLPIPGGWKWETVALEQNSWRLLLPADPDAFILEAPAQEEWPDPYWAQLWPAAKTIAKLVLAQEWPTTTRILELGCGNGFVGLAAASRGWHVTFSDYVSFAVELSLANARGNGFANVAGEVTDWRKPTADHAFERIIACECLYDPELHVPLLQTMNARLKSGGFVWLCDPGRGELAGQFARIAAELGWRVLLFDEQLRPQEKFVWQEFRLIQLQR